MNFARFSCRLNRLSPGCLLQSSLARSTATRRFSSLTQQFNQSNQERTRKFFGFTGFLVGAATAGTLWSFLSKAEEVEHQPIDNNEDTTITPGIYIKGLPDYSKDEVANHKSEDTGIWVYYKEGVYDISEFVHMHPGGKEKISLAAGKSIEPFWALYGIHKKEEVYEILENWRIGNLVLSEEEKKADELDINDPYADEPQRSPLLHVNSEKPFNAEPPSILLVENFLTPNELFFVRNHLPIPKININEYRLQVKISDAEDAPVKIYTLEDLKTKFSKREVIATIQCAGNRRDELNQVKPIKGLSWTGSAISNAKWSGVSLRDILLDAGLDESASGLAHIQFEGLDTDGSSSYGASIPIEKALSISGDVLLAFEMNDEELPIDHGYPLRVVVPGHVGARNVKWVSKIQASAEESKSHWQRRDYKAFSPSSDWNDVDWDSTPSIQELPIQSLICFPPADSKISDDEIELKGYAWSGGGRGITRVELSIDGGETWVLADLHKANKDETMKPTEQNFNRNWSWSLWSAKIQIPESVKGSFSVCCRAVDTSYNVQPELTRKLWNIRGVVNNSWHKVPFYKE